MAALGFIQRSAARWSRTTSFAVTLARVEFVVNTLKTTCFKLGASKRDCFTAVTNGAKFFMSQPLCAARGGGGELQALWNMPCSLPPTFKLPT
jgi:hypothetical protein